MAISSPEEQAIRNRWAAEDAAWENEQIARDIDRREAEWPIALDDAAKVRLRAISAETGRDVADLIRSAAEEAALDYFRQRADDPARRAI